MECRIYAEDPENNYFPSPGRITQLQEPSGPGIRLDSGIYQGWSVPLDYDPLLAKLIAYGEDRQQAISRLRRAIDEYFVGGVKTNLGLFRTILSNKEFLEGKADTGMLSRLPSKAPSPDPCEEQIAAIAACVFRSMDAGSPGLIGPAVDASPSAWKKTARSEGVS